MSPIPGRYDIWHLLLAATTAWSCVDPIASPPPPDVAAVVVDSSAGSVFRTLIVELDGPAAVQVDYWADATPRLRVTSRTIASQHEVFIARLRAQTSYSYEVRALSESGEVGDPASGRFMTDTLPAALAAYRFIASGTPTLPLVMLELRGAYSGFVAVDGDGQVVWFWPGGPQGFTRLSNGDFVFLYSNVGLFQVTPDRRTVAQLDQADAARFHHDVVATNRNTVLVITDDTATVGDTLWTGDAIWEWNPATGSAQRRWSAFQVFAPSVDRGPRTVPDDWLHCNALGIAADGTILVSSPFLSQVFAISSDFQSIRWRLGGPGSTYTLPPDGVFSFQHTASETGPNRVLVFDNGRDRADGSQFSRALEVQLDAGSGTASKVWEFRPVPDNWAPVISSARRLANGNTVVAFGTSAGVVGATGPIIVYEVTNGGRGVWSMRVEGTINSMYRGTPLRDIGGEREVAEP